MGKVPQNPPQFIIARIPTNACAHQIAWAFCVMSALASAYSVLAKLEALEVQIEVLLDDFSDDTEREIKSISLIYEDGIRYVEIALEPESQ